jgi:MFS family permease
MQGKYFWIVLCSAFILLIVKLDAFVVNVSLPTIAHAFSLNAAQTSMIIVVYLLMLTNTMLIFGKLEDRLGIRKILIAGYIIFTLGSLFSGLAPSILTLILARGLQGIGGAMLLICGFSAVNKFLPKEIEGWGLGIVTTAAALGIATGAPLGGYITHYFNWRWIFFVNVPLGVLGLLVSAGTLPKETISKSTASQPFDYLGAILSFTGLSILTYVLSNGGQWGWGSMPTLGLFFCFISYYPAIYFMANQM